MLKCINYTNVDLSCKTVDTVGRFKICWTLKTVEIC